MSDTEALKKSLLNAQWRLHKVVSVPGADGPVELAVRRPPSGKVVELLEQAQKDGLVGADGQMTGGAQGLRFLARLVAQCVWLPNAARPLFNEEEALAWPGLDEVKDVVQEAISPPDKAMERIQGK